MRFPSPLLRGTSCSRKSLVGRDTVPLIFCHSVAKSCLTLCDPINCSTPGFPVLHYLPELLKLMSIELVMPSNYLILCCPLLLLLSIFPSIRFFSSELAFCIKWPKYWSFSFSKKLIIKNFKYVFSKNVQKNGCVNKSLSFYSISPVSMGNKQRRLGTVISKKTVCREKSL